MKLKLIILTILLLLSGGLIGFYKLGGFNPVEIEERTLDFILSGTYYRGTPQDKRLTLAFKQIQEVQEANPDTRLHTIYMVEPAGKLDTMEVYVGIDKDLPAILGSWDRLNFKNKKFLVAKIRGNRFVMPGPEKVKRQLQQFAKDKGMELEDLFIDKIISPEHVEVMAPIK